MLLIRKQYRRAALAIVTMGALIMSIADNGRRSLTGFARRYQLREEYGSEAIQFILLAVILGIGLVVVFAYIRDTAKTAGTRVGSCINSGSTTASC